MTRLPRTLSPVVLGLALLGCGSGDPGGGKPDGPPDPPGADCAQVVGGPASGVHVLRFEAAGGGTRVHLRRRYVQYGVGESVIYGLDAMWIERAGTCLPILEASALGYTNSHHNWHDQARGQGAGINHVLTIDRMIPGTGWTIRLTGTGSDGAAAFPAIDLVTTGGPNALSETPARLPVRVTELMAENTSGWRDQAGELAPWIELFNPSSEAVDLTGWSLSNDPAQRRRWLFPSGTAIGRHQVLVVAADGQTDQGPLHASFQLAPGAGSVVLTDPAGVTAGERSYPAVGANQSVRFDDATDRLVPSPTATPGSVALD